MTHMVENNGPARPVAPVATPVERLEYIGDLAGVLQVMAVDGGHTRLAALLDLARSEAELLRHAFWTGTGR